MNNMESIAEKATILLIDDHPMLRNGVKQLLSLIILSLLLVKQAMVFRALN